MQLNWDQLLADCVDFTQRLIQTPSMPYEEEAAAALVAAEMRALAFDEVWEDEMGNVYGRIHGQDRSLPALVLNSHLDHVDPGDPALWPAPPYGGEIDADHIVGRGAVDIKGPLAVQVYGMAALRRAGERPRRDVVFTGVVQEEIGGAGALYWVEHLDYEVALVILGEPSDNELALGHRGIRQLWVQFNGRSAHASAPQEGLNPNYALAAFLHHLEKEQGALRRHELLGPTTVSPTIIEVDTKSANVTPAWTRVLLDFRTASESLNSLRAFIRRLAGEGAAQMQITSAWELGDADPDAAISGFYTPPHSDAATRMRELLAAGMGREPALTSYNFATDGRHFVPYEIPVVGYAPGEEAQAHVAGERIAIAKMSEGLRGYVQILRHF